MPTFRYFRLKLALIQFSMLDFLKVFKKLHQQVGSILRQSEVLHKKVRFEEVVHVRFAEFDYSERGADLLDEFFADCRLLNRQHMLDTAENADVDRWSASKYLLKLFFFHNSFDSLAFFFNSV